MADTPNKNGDGINSLSRDSELTDPPGTVSLSSPAYATFNAAQHKAVTRRAIAVLILAMLMVLYAIGAVAFVLHDIKATDLAKLIAFFSGIQTLAAAAFGFYFAKSQ